MIFVSTSDDVSRQRNVERGDRGGRTVPENLRSEKWKEAKQSADQYRRMFEIFFEVDNSTDLRYADRETKQRIEAKFLEIHRFFRKFVARPVRNPAALEWISQQGGKYSPARSHKFESMNEGITDYIRKALSPGKEHQYAQTVPEYRKAVDKSSGRRTLLSIASSFARQYDFDTRSFYEYLIASVKRGNLDKKYIERKDWPKAIAEEQIEESAEDVMIDQMRKAYADINRIDPSGPSYKKLVAILNKSDQKTLKRLAMADIKWVSSLARNRLKEDIDEENLQELSRDKLMSYREKAKDDINSTMDQHVAGKLSSAEAGPKMLKRDRGRDLAGKKLTAGAKVYATRKFLHKTAARWK